MEQIAKDRFLTMAETYDKMAQILVPNYDLFQDEVFKITRFSPNQELIIIDLGAGSGIFLEKALTLFPNSFAYWVDYSYDFKRVAEERLNRFGNRVNYILSPIEKNWEEQLEQKPDLIFSMSAIHHLPNNEKQNLYNKCFRILNEGGWFFNADEMKTMNNKSYKESLAYWAEYVVNAKSKVPAQLHEHYEKWNSHFENWKLRNIDNFGHPKMKGDDIHENFITQLNWLSSIGFINEDVFLKYRLWALIGGQK